MFISILLSSLVVQIGLVEKAAIVFSCGSFSCVYLEIRVVQLWICMFLFLCLGIFVASSFLKIEIMD